MKLFFVLSQLKQIPVDSPIDINHVSDGTLKDIEYFQKDLKMAAKKQIVNYTWEKPVIDQSPNFYKPHDVDIKHNKFELKNSLDLMATYSQKNHPHISKQNEWQSNTTQPPTFLPMPPKRRVVVLSTMSQYMENMNKSKTGPMF